MSKHDCLAEKGKMTWTALTKDYVTGNESLETGP